MVERMAIHHSIANAMPGNVKSDTAQAFLVTPPAILVHLRVPRWSCGTRKKIALVYRMKHATDMLGWLRRLFHPSDMIDFDLACGRIAAAKVQLYSPEDFDSCCELYRLNEPGRFPLGHLPDYEKALQS